MHDGMTHFQHALEADQRLVIDFIFSQQLGVVAEISQEPGQFPHRFRCAVKPAGNQAADQMLGFENCEADLVIRFLHVPAILRAINPDEE